MPGPPGSARSGDGNAAPGGSIAAQAQASELALSELGIPPAPCWMGRCDQCGVGRCYAVPAEEARNYAPTVVLLDEGNLIKKAA